MTAAMDRIGSIEILRTRIYQLDAESHDDLCSTVIVEPGRHDLYSDGMTTFWLMRGHLNMRGSWRLGDGMFVLSTSDAPSEIEVTFPSKRFGPDEWADLLASPEFTDGHGDQRIRVSIDAAVSAS